jgi:salicylate hydroxylase
MGLGKVVADLGGRVGEGSRYCRSDGSAVGAVRTADSAGEHGVYGMHRADLLGALADGLPPGTVRTGHRCVGFEQDAASARLTFGNGTSAEADVVVAADGIHSSLQRSVVEPAAPLYSGYVAYRGLITADRLPGWPRNVHLVWMGEQKHFMVYPVRRGTLLNYVGFLPSAEAAEETWSGAGDPNALRAAFAEWDPLVVELLSRVEETYWWGLFDREPLPAWTNGRLTLLGDAAHPMLPHLGQGANQSIEDGVALAVLLSDRASGDAPRALRSYEMFRRPRTAQVQEGARANGRRYDSQYEDLRKRDAEVSVSGELRAWLYDYDVELRAREFAQA